MKEIFCLEMVSSFIHDIHVVFFLSLLSFSFLFVFKTWILRLTNGTIIQQTGLEQLMYALYCVLGMYLGNKQE